MKSRPRLRAKGQIKIEIKIKTKVTVEEKQMGEVEIAARIVTGLSSILIFISACL
ncbi:hypothetical protein M1B72_06285 [Geomonas paludis]|uniref:Uncharacterized protein n=1 Tax=Geomonas paludis TaxID=2740185 RepID=A0ABY4LH37_9BACT|nr:hypothetical protein [Geomonas paludis]UPU37310.1 hypothetical protein M1B72_06285 [Geomonas paludis]